MRVDNSTEFRLRAEALRGGRHGGPASKLRWRTAKCPPGQWQPAYPPQSLTRPRTWPAIALASIAVLLGAVALVVAATRSTHNSTPSSPTTSAAPTYTAAEPAAAHKKLCDSYRLAARAVQIETNGTSPERAGIAEVNGAMILKDAVDASPAITPSDRAGRGCVGSCL